MGVTDHLLTGMILQVGHLKNAKKHTGSNELDCSWLRRKCSGLENPKHLIIEGGGFFIVSTRNGLVDPCYRWDEISLITRGKNTPVTNL